MLLTLTVCPKEQRTTKKVKPIFSVRAHACLHLQILIFISARDEENQELLKYFKNKTACLSSAKTFTKVEDNRDCLLYSTLEKGRSEHAVFLPKDC